MSHRAGVVDHIVAISAGGSRMSSANLWTLCFDCHKWKTAMEQHHALSVAGFGEDGELTPPQSERERIKQLIKEKIQYV